MQQSRNAAADSGGISFVITVYNKAPWLAGVCAQIGAQRGDFAREYIFVDDGSTDGSVEVIEAATAGWPAVTIHRQANAGPAVATNVGLKLARYPLVKFVDADDLLHADATLHLMQALRSVPEAVAAYGGSASYDDSAALDLLSTLGEPALRIDRDPVASMIRSNLFNPSMGLVRRDAALRAGGCDERLRAAQDYTLALRLAGEGPFVSFAEPIAFLPQEVPGRVGALQNRQLQRGTQALSLHLADNPHLPARYGRLACRIAAGRSWKYASRILGERWWSSRHFWRQVQAYLPAAVGHSAFVGRCAEAFEKTP